ncbi:MAG: nickel-dependent hydrogenase large subunit [Pseudomonadota bacterium]|nr:nickel-dependent hydrogenase large subunit [Pseudomonadota bacterium]
MSLSIADSAGAIHVRLATDRGRVVDVDLSSTRRPDLYRRMFIGRSLDDLLGIVPLIFSVCATAQAAAAVRACERAAGVEAASVQERARDLLVLAENAREHLLRILLGWSEWLGSPPAASWLAAVGRMRGAWHGALFPEADGFRLGGGRLRPDRSALDGLLADLTEVIAGALGATPDAWLAVTRPDELASWYRSGDSLAQRLVRSVTENGWARLGGSPIEPLPHLPGEQVGRLLAGASAEQFTAMPEWDEVPRETGALERQARRPLIASLKQELGNGLMTRLAARLAELASLPSRIRTLLEGLAPGAPAPAPETPTGSGLAEVEAARGRLIHWVCLDEGVVEDFRILAPTEWNFHPRGVLSSGLRTLSADADLARLARLLVDAVDPCVECRIEVDGNT